MPETMSLEQFNLRVLKAVNKGLEILGDEPVKKTFYFHIKKKANIKQEDIPCDLDAFHDALNGLFFDGTVILEKRMARNLFDMLNLEFEENPRWKLSDYVKKAKSCLTINR